jgi:hypothetical protein
MITKIYYAKNHSLSVCLNKIKDEFLNDLGEADFLFFAVNPDFDINLINIEINRIFKTDKFLAFNAVDSFANYEIVEGVVLCAIQFERNGKIDTFYIEDIYEKSSITKTVEYLNNNQDKFHIILAGICNGEMAFFIDKVSDKLNYTPINNIIGGISSGNLEADELHTFQFIDNKIIKNGLVIVSFENIEYASGVSLGFKPYGINYKVAKAKGNKLYNIDDGRSASYMAYKLLRDIGIDDTRYLWYTPLHILSEEGGYTTTLRTIKEVTDKYIELFAPVKNGDFFKLSFATATELIEEDKRIARGMLKTLQNPEIAFNFSCIARQYVLEDKQKEESQIYMDLFRTNLFGFFTFGEIGSDKLNKKLRFFNETSLVVIMKEI